MSRDQQIEALIKQIEAKTAEIRTQEQVSWKTNCSFPSQSLAQAGSVNIRTLSKAKLIEAYAQVLQKESLYVTVKKELGDLYSSEAEAIGSYPLEDWKHDIKNMLKLTDLRAKKVALEEGKAKLEKMFSEEHLTDKLIGNMTDLLGN
jgi:hypothetical protein